MDSGIGTLGAELFLGLPLGQVAGHSGCLAWNSWQIKGLRTLLC